MSDRRRPPGAPPLSVAEVAAIGAEQEERRVADLAALEARLKAVPINSLDVASLAARFALRKEVAERLLRVHGGDTERAADALVFVGVAGGVQGLLAATAKHGPAAGCGDAIPTDVAPAPRRPRGRVDAVRREAAAVGAVYTREESF